jgi:eukaryotic-like serine/threonine-protein kinase
MDASKWQRIQDLFHQALERPQEERGDFVHSACGDDQEIEADVLALLEEDAAADSFLDRGLGSAANALLGDAPAMPRRIGAYRVVRQLGEGGMGVVYLGQDETLGRSVAIKVLRDARLSPDRRERFLREQHILGRLSHPLICRLYEAGILPDGTPYFVMEYLDGVPLTTYWEDRELSLRRRLHLFRQVCLAVQYAHRQALIHRDLKPSNIYVVENADGEPSIKLLDFGIAKPAVEEGEARLTRTGFGVLTPAYASPEQLRGHPLAVSTDVYSLGVVLYELLTGSLPYDLAGLSPFDAAERVISQDVERPSQRVRRLDPAPVFIAAVGRPAWADLDALCSTALEREPERRYATVEALLRDVDHYLEGQPLEARPAGLRYRLGKFVGRHRRAVAAALAVGLVVSGMIAFYTYRLAQARDAALAEAARSQRIQRFLLGLFKDEDPELASKRDFTVEMLMERGVREARVLTQDPALQAELYQTWGEVYRRMVRFDRADRLLQDALAQRRDRYGDIHPDVADAWRALALLRLDQENLPEAERLAREALATLEASLGPAGLHRDHPRYVDALEALGLVLRDQGRYDEAIEILQEAAELRQAGDDTGGLIATLGPLADAHWYLGQYAESDRLNRRRLELVEEHLGANHPLYAASLSNLGASRAQLGDAQEAEALYRRSLAINEAYYGPEHPAVATDLSLLGKLLAVDGRRKEARPYLEEALALREKIYGPDHNDVALTLSHLGDLHNNLGTEEDLATAETYFSRALAIFQQRFEGPHPWTAAALGNMAVIHFKRARKDLAEEAQRQALTMFEALLPADHIDVAINRIRLGQILSEREKYSAALVPLLEAHRVLETQVDPSHLWLTKARSELAFVYEALGDPTRAAQYRDEKLSFP